MPEIKEKEYKRLGEFEPDQPAGKAIQKWWSDLKDNAGERATLRRAKNGLEVAMQPAYYRLLSALAKENLKINLTDKLPFVAGLLAHVKEHQALAFAKQMKGSNDKNPVSDLRFRRILRIENRDDLYVMMIRFIRMLDGKANIYDIAHSILYWSDRVKKEWASQYYLSEDWNSEQDNNEMKQQKGA
jgi:CRISPR system Cascade subunit CasB